MPDEADLDFSEFHVIENVHENLALNDLPGLQNKEGHLGGGSGRRTSGGGGLLDREGESNGIRHWNSLTFPVDEPLHFPMDPGYRLRRGWLCDPGHDHGYQEVGQDGPYGCVDSQGVRSPDEGR